MSNKFSKKAVSVALSVTTVVWLTGASLIVPVVAQTSTVDLQAQIDALMAQIIALQTQLGIAGGGVVSTACSFAKDLTLGSRGDDVKCLQQYLNSTAYKVAVSGVGSAGNETTYFGPLTKAATAAWQAGNAVSPPAGYFGPISRAKYTSIAAVTPTTPTTPTEPTTPTTPTEPTTPTTPTTPVTGTGLTVGLASDTPAAATLPDGSAYNKVTKLNLTAGTDGDVKVTGLKITRGGFSLNADFTGVMVFDANGARHGNVVTISESKALIMFASDPITVPAGQTVAVTIQVNIDAAQETNGTFAFGIDSVSDVYTADAVVVSGTFPVTGSTFAVINGANTLGAIDIDAVTISATTRTVDLNNKDYQIGKFRFYETAGKEDVQITSIRLYNNGNTTDADLANVKLKNDTTGEVLATVVATSGKYVTFVLSPALTIPKGQNKTVAVSADVVNGSTRTAQFILQNDYDVTAVGVSTGGGLLSTHATNLAGDTSAGFPVGDLTTAYNSITVASGSLTVAKDSSSPFGYLSQGQNSAVLGIWKVEAVGEDIELQKADFSITGSSAATDFSGSVSLMIGNTTIYSTSTLTNLFDDDADGADQVSLSNYYVVPAGTSVLVKMIANVASGATNSATVVGNFGDVYYKKVSSNNYNTASTDVLIPANAWAVSTAGLTVAKNSAYGNQNVVGGGANTKIGSYLLQAGSAEGVNVSSINIDMSAITGMTNMKLRKVNADGSETQVGSTVSAPSTTDDANSFSVGGQLNISASGTVVINIYVDMSSSAVTVSTDIDAADITASGSSSGTALSGNVPAAAVTGQTVTLRTAGTLLVETDTSTPVEGVVHASESNRELLRLKFTSQYEDVILDELVFASRRGDANLSSVSVTTGAVTVSTTPINGVSTFSGLTITVPKDSTLVVNVKGSFTTSGTMISAEDVRLNLESLSASGLSSGSAIYELARTTTATVGDIAADTATALTVGSTEGFAVGDVVQAHTAQGVSSFTGVVTAVGSATSLTVAGPQNLADCATVTCYVTKLATREAITSKVMGTPPTLLHTDGADTIDVSSTRGLAVGDVLRIEATSGTTDDGGFYTVTAVTDGDTINVIGVTEGDTSIVAYGTAATDRVTRMATSTSTQTKTATDGIVANTASAIDVDSTIGFAVGDVVVLNSTVAAAATRPLYVVAAVTDADTLSLIGKGAQTNIPADSWVTKLASTRTTTVSTASVITADTASAVTLTSVSGFAVGDVVYIQDDATAGGDLYMVSAVSTTTITVIGETGFTASAGAFVTRLASSTGNGKPYTVHDVEPVITLDPLSPGASGTVSGSTNQIVAVFDILASGGSALTVKAITLTRGGNVGTRVSQTAADPKAYDYTSGSLGSLLGTGGDWSGTAAGSTSAVTFDTPYTITAGQMLKIAVTVDTSAAIANDTFQVYVDNTGGLAGLFGGLSWYYTAVSPSPGIEPTDAAPSTLADTYPVFGNTLRY